MEVVDASSGFSTIICDYLGKIVDCNDIFSVNNIILFVSVAITIFVVCVKMKIIPSSVVEKIPMLNKLLGGEKKQVEFAKEQSEDEEDGDDELYEENKTQ